MATSLATPSSIQKLQKALHDKAKESPSYRFYALYDKVYRKDVPACAYDRCHANRGAAGVDGQEFEDIEKYGVERWLDELAEELKSRTYQPQPVRRVMIDKPGGGKRPLGIQGKCLGKLGPRLDDVADRALALRLGGPQPRKLDSADGSRCVSSMSPTPSSPPGPWPLFG